MKSRPFAIRFHHTVAVSRFRDSSPLGTPFDGRRGLDGGLTIKLLGSIRADWYAADLRIQRIKGVTSSVLAVIEVQQYFARDSSPHEMDVHEIHVKKKTCKPCYQSVFSLQVPGDQRLFSDTSDSDDYHCWPRVCAEPSDPGRETSKIRRAVALKNLDQVQRERRDGKTNKNPLIPLRFIHYCFILS